MTELFEAAEEVVDELFPPKPGGLVDRHRRRKAREQAQLEEDKQAQERIEQPSARSVKVAAQSPEVLSAITYTIPVGAYQQILPASPYRYRALIQLVTWPSSVIFAKDSGAALGGVGFMLAASGNFPAQFFETFTRAQLYAFNNYTGVIQVAVLAELYAPEQTIMPRPQ